MMGVMDVPDIHVAYGELSFVWDENKNLINLKKHGITFDIAARVFDDDLRLEYPRPRT